MTKVNPRWMDGPWNDEPDHERFMSCGLYALIKRGPMGHFCGYVGVTPDHPLHGVGYSDETAVLGKQKEARLEQPIGEHPSMPVMLSALLGGDIKASPDCVIDVHGGLTFSDVWKDEEPAGLWWFGFDCAHCDDLTPSETRPEYKPWRRDAAYRDINYVRNEVRKLAEQLAAVGK